MGNRPTSNGAYEFVRSFVDYLKQLCDNFCELVGIKRREKANSQVQQQGNTTRLALEPSEEGQKGKKKPKKHSKKKRKENKSNSKPKAKATKIEEQNLREEQDVTPSPSTPAPADPVVKKEEDVEAVVEISNIVVEDMSTKEDVPSTSTSTRASPTTIRDDGDSDTREGAGKKDLPGRHPMTMQILEDTIHAATDLCSELYSTIRKGTLSGSKTFAELSCNLFDQTVEKLHDLVVRTGFFNAFFPPIGETQFINVGVIGCTSAGKTTFLNALFDRNDPVGIEMVTAAKSKAGEIPVVKGDPSRLLRYFDFPGLTVPLTQLDNPMDTIFTMYQDIDVFLILYRNTPDSPQLTQIARAMHAVGKDVVWVRTGVDEAEGNDKNSAAVQSSGRRHRAFDHDVDDDDDDDDDDVDDGNAAMTRNSRPQRWRRRKRAKMATPDHSEQVNDDDERAMSENEYDEDDSAASDNTQVSAFEKDLLKQPASVQRALRQDEELLSRSNLLLLSPPEAGDLSPQFVGPFVVSAKNVIENSKKLLPLGQRPTYQWASLLCATRNIATRRLNGIEQQRSAMMARSEDDVGQTQLNPSLSAIVPFSTPQAPSSSSSSVAHTRGIFTRSMRTIHPPFSL